MKKSTIITHCGIDPKANSGAVNVGVFHASTIVFDSYADFKKSWDGTFKGVSYGRYGTNTHRAFEEVICQLEGADNCLITNSGVSATSCVMLGLLKSGDHVLVTDNAYSPTRHFCNSELKKFGIETTYYDPTIGAGIAKLIRPNTKLIYIESPGSLTLEVTDVPAITKVAKAYKVITVLDNTWATAWYFNGIENGIDVTITSATKYIGGHSDVLIGTICCGDKIYPQIKRMHKSLGICAGADDVYLALRGLRTLGVRLEHQQKAALGIAKALEKHKKIAAVLHPALSSHPQNKIFKRDFSGSSGLFSFVLNKKLSSTEHSKFLDNMSLFKMGYSWGGFESLIIPFDLSKIRTSSKFAYSGSAFRISIGLEDEAELLADLESALGRV